MKVLSIINFHSYVDLITNSSSELFVCDTDKSIKLVKSIVEKIAGSKNIWGSMFNEPTICKVDFDLSNYPDQEDVKMVTDWSYFDAEDREIDKKRDALFPRPDCMKGKEWKEYKDNPKYKKWAEETHVFYIASKTPQRERERAARKRIEDFFKLDDSTSVLLSYKIKAKKGSIILCSASDNSVSYEIFDEINRALNARNYHIG